MVKFDVLPEALGEAIEAAVWYDDRQQSLGTEFLADLQFALDAIRAGTGSLARLETYSGPHDIRRVLLKRFPYAVVVVCRPEEVAVVAVAHTRRRPLYWLKRTV